jgi:small subunit ribosomal protein S1
MDDPGTQVRVELGEGVQATCRMTESAPAPEQPQTNAKADLSALSSMLKARWKGESSTAAAKQEAPRAGQIRSFRIVRLDRDAKTIALELA